MKHKFKTNGVCPSFIKFDLNGEVVTNVEFEGGCPGNLKAIPILVDGLTATQIESKLSTITCGKRSTSCAAELSKFVMQASEESVQ
ncbi:TIGR03905 family TSCPD domain-containing protein [Mycoplasma sp. P36-A1]|uniref:TIGR03905 family TSCPD domain-containing protein n=1 Tax=Mycoplasma sp. P36-A1 TaxID=3252900 RepID=UPI003C30B486